ncbi:hypothetical protein KC321_g11432, partial [Hortaea werneckii]
METFNKLAGVQDVSSPTERPSQPHVLPTPPPIPDSDTDPLAKPEVEARAGRETTATPPPSTSPSTPKPPLSTKPTSTTLLPSTNQRSSTTNPNNNNPRP